MVLRKGSLDLHHQENPDRKAVDSIRLKNIITFLCAIDSRMPNSLTNGLVAPLEENRVQRE